MKYFFGVLGVVVIAIVAIILLSRTPSTNNSGQKPGGQAAVKLIDYIEKDDSQVEWTVQGRVVGEDQRRAISISVSDSERRIEILQGYEEQIERSASYPNTQAAFDTFMRALDLAGFSKERKVPLMDERGVCPLGNRHIYTLTDGRDRPVRLWSASCAPALGPFAGNTSLVQQLFQGQITDYPVQIRGVVL